MGQGEGQGGDVTDNWQVGSGSACLLICLFTFISIPVLIAGIVMVTILGLSNQDVYNAGIALTVIGAVLVLVLFIIILLVCFGCLPVSQREPKTKVVKPATPEYRGEAVLWDGAYGTETLGFRADTADKKVY